MSDNENIRRFILKKIFELDVKRETVEQELSATRQSGTLKELEELQTKKFKLDIIINYLGKLQQKLK